MRLGILITTYNRPDYLRQCLESVRRSDIPEGSTIMIVDDASSDPEIKRLIDLFVYPGVNIHKSFKSKNLSIKDSLLHGCDILFYANNCDLVCNLDGDAIVRKDFLHVLLKLKERFPENIVTGFNCLTKNKNGTERHVVVESGDGYNKKKSVGGLNMFFDRLDYTQYIRPALTKTLSEGGNWDHAACLLAASRGLDIVCSVPSVCNHIGINSSMGHSAGGEPPDVAEDFVDEKNDYGTRLYVLNNKQGNVTHAKLHLPMVTLILADDDISRIQKAANVSCDFIEFGAVKLLSSSDSEDPRAIKIRHLGSKKEYSQFVLKELYQYVDTPYMLLAQHDGYVLNFEAWRDAYLDYDMVGAVWEFRDHKRTSNGGFSLRSKRMMEAVAKDESIYLQNDHIITNYAEDHVLFYIYREYLEKHHSVKIAPEHICNQFSIEAWGRKDKRYKGSFGFHGFGIDFSESNIKHKPY